MDIYDDLPKPYFVLAPMDDVTDTVFRQLIASTAPPDLFFTEFVNVDALQSAGRKATLPRLRFEKNETPLIAQIWGKNPENYYKTAKQLADGTIAEEANRLRTKNGDVVQGKGEERNEPYIKYGEVSTGDLNTAIRPKHSGMIGSANQQAGAVFGFAGVDINMGCPVKDVVQNGCCSALMNNREMAKEIIDATKKGSGSLPVSIKTRLGFNEIDYTWHEFLLKQKLNALTIHVRTRKDMSKVQARWDAIGEIVKLRDKLSPTTQIIGNGDVLTREQGEEIAKKYNLDGIMIGRGVFHDPYIFAKKSNWETMTPGQKKDIYTKHVKLFDKTWKNSEKPIVILNKFCKIYINGFDGAKELREKLMQAKTTEEILSILV